MLPASSRSLHLPRWGNCCQTFSVIIFEHDFCSPPRVRINLSRCVAHDFPADYADSPAPVL